MDVLDSKTDKELIQSILAEVAKANAEVRHAQGDLEKAQSRLKFTILLANTLIERQGD
jgi:hypothetical protein